MSTSEQNPANGRRKSRPRGECLNEHLFGSLKEARRIIEAWRIDLYEEPNVKSADGSPAITRVMTIMLADEY